MFAQMRIYLKSDYRRAVKVKVSKFKPSLSDLVQRKN